MKRLKGNLENVIFSISFLIVLILYGIGMINLNLFFGSLGSIATSYYGVLKIKIEKDILFKELFGSFNERYDDKMNDLINDLKRNEDRELNKDKGEENLIIDYFNLCAEEYLWKKKNRIPKDVWIAWRAGILENMKIRQIKEVYEKEILSETGKLSYYGLSQELSDKKNQ